MSALRLAKHLGLLVVAVLLGAAAPAPIVGRPQKGVRSLVALGWIARAARPRAESQ
jgi:hypothetical protein